MRTEPRIKSVLFIRRDNIGDLVCTTPAIRAIRRARPDARIGVLVNSYNAEAIRGNPDVNEVFVYEKWKHSGGRSRLAVWFQNWKELRRVRQAGFDAAIGCGYAWSKRLARLTRSTGARMRIGIGPPEGATACYTHPVSAPTSSIHEVEAVMRLVEPIGITAAPPGLVLQPDAIEVSAVMKKLGEAGMRGGRRLVAMHVSSRREQNRWPRGSFIKLGDMLHTEGADVMLLWSPGTPDNPLHPGDDALASEIASSMKTPPFSIRTERLGELIAALSAADAVVCCDGGAMHIAAGLGKPIVAVWGSTDERRWHPWGVPYIILRRDGTASATGPDEAFAACKRLFLKG
ncbi:MAG: glycosyltransferase family 9 protein [Deltaproteobacteria bacterium]|nr:glycosyltransferase family 9 protein [Deltaproteobacteria bacterium]